MGDSYAIPTKDDHLRTLPLEVIRDYVDQFLAYAAMCPFEQFQLTPIGCGLAGYRRQQIEPLFACAPNNVLWPPEWHDPDQAWLDARDAEFDDRWNARMNP